VPLTNPLIVPSLSAAQDKIEQLAKAISADDYDYLPMAGVSNGGEVLTHLAGANYYIAKMLGHSVPAGVDPRALGAAADKAEMQALYTASGEHLK